MKKLTTKSMVSTLAALFMGSIIFTGCGGDGSTDDGGSTNGPPADGGDTPDAGSDDNN